MKTLCIEISQYYRSGSTAEKAAIVITAVVLIIMVCAALFLPYDKAGQAGDWIGGFGGALAFLWFVIAMNLQRTELAEQRQQLVLQKEALLLQKQELSRMGKFAGYQQISEIMKETKKELFESKAGVKSISELINLALPKVEWQTILNSTDPQEVYNTCISVMPREAAITTFFSGVKQAINIYKESIGVKVESTPEDLAEFVYTNSPWLKNIPHVSQYAGTIELTAQMHWMFSPGRKAVMLAFLIATALVLKMPDVIKEKEMYKMYLDAKERGNLPEIAKYYKFSEETIKSTLPIQDNKITS